MGLRPASGQGMCEGAGDGCGASSAAVAADDTPQSRCLPPPPTFPPTSARSHTTCCRRTATAPVASSFAELHRSGGTLSTFVLALGWLVVLPSFATFICTRIESVFAQRATFLLSGTPLDTHNNTASVCVGC